MARCVGGRVVRGVSIEFLAFSHTFGEHRHFFTHRIELLGHLISLATSRTCDSTVVGEVWADILALGLGRLFTLSKILASGGGVPTRDDGRVATAQEPIQTRSGRRSAECME